jgi:pyridoxamine 5'-phosphate oxidase-like protein
MRWETFVQACPELAEIAWARFVRDQLVLVGTLRKDGWPRISPCEVDLAAGHLFLGMMWQSKKALDLRRDPRVVVHSVTCNRDGADGDVKLYGRAMAITDPRLRSAYREAIQVRIDWAPEKPEFHLFSMDIEQASFVKFGETRQMIVWDSERGIHWRSVDPR